MFLHCGVNLSNHIWVIYSDCIASFSNSYNKIRVIDILIGLFCRFLLQLSCQSAALDGPGNLSVVEANAFKHLNHLSLRLIQGSDRDVKDYLAACFSTLKVAESVRGGCVRKLFAQVCTLLDSVMSLMAAVLFILLFKSVSPKHGEEDMRVNFIIQH